MLDASDEARIRELVKAATKEALTEALKNAIDVDIDDVDHRKALRADLSFARAQREFYAAAVRHGFITSIGIVLIGIAAAIWSAIRLGVAK